MRRLIVPAMTVVLLAGCGQSDYSEHVFKSTEELIEAAGLDCSLGEDEAATSDSLGEYGFANAPCNNSSVTIWESDTKRDEIQGKEFNALEAGWCRVEGGNWTVTGAQFIAEEVYERMGGEIECV